MFWENLLNLCNSKNISPNKVCADLGLSNATATRWKKGSVPRGTTLIQIAEYFGVTPEEMLSDVKVSPPGELPQGLDEKTTEVVMKLSRLSDEQKAKVLSFLEYLAFQENQGTQ
jgi:transcriptional regulator with XRE-family HTH domain